MDAQVVIKNNNLTATISLLGGELISYTKNNQEVIYQGKENYWKGHCPLLFPNCGGLKDETYFYNGVKYPLAKHGFIRFKQFNIVSKQDNKVILERSEDEETLKSFPFKFVFQIVYELTDRLLITVNVTNLDNKSMYFTFGSHEGYQLDDDFESYYLKFDRTVPLIASVLDGKLLSRETLNHGTNNVFPLKNKDYEIDAQVFRNLGVNQVTLCHKEKGEILRVHCQGPKHLLVWSPNNANFVCIEPWFATPDFVDQDGEIKDKEDVILLECNKTFSYTHSIEIL